MTLPGPARAGIEATINAQWSVSKDSEPERKAD
jgi:hypothetical protein